MYENSKENFEKSLKITNNFRNYLKIFRIFKQFLSIMILQFTKHLHLIQGRNQRGGGKGGIAPPPQ